MAVCSLPIAGCSSGGPDAGGGVSPTKTSDTPNSSPTSTTAGASTTTAQSAVECPDPPAPETDPKALLPVSPAGWEQTGWDSEAAGMVGAEVGVSGTYTDPEGERYDVELIRWPSENDAEDGLQIYRGSDSDWKVRLALGRFTFAVSGPAIGPAKTLLTASPALTETCVDEQGNTPSSS